MNRTYQEIRAYSPQYDCMTARISMTDANHQEFYMLVPQPTSKRRRVERHAACDLIEEAIDGGLLPGQVIVSDDVWKEAVNFHVNQQAAVELRELAA